MKNNMCIHVEFLAGTDITQAIEEAKQKARHWDVAYVKFDFNGVRFSIGQDANVQKAVDKFHSDPKITSIVEFGR